MIGITERTVTTLAPAFVVVVNSTAQGRSLLPPS